MEHYPITVKTEEVPDVVISGITCSSLGVVFLADSGRSQIYRLDITDGTCFSFGKDVLNNIKTYIISGVISILLKDVQRTFPPSQGGN